MAAGPEKDETPAGPSSDAVDMEGQSTPPEKEEAAAQVWARPEREPKAADYFVSLLSDTPLAMGNKRFGY